jgi:hypothetical protein
MLRRVILALALCVISGTTFIGAAQDAGATPSYYVTATVDREEVYIGQQVVYSFRLYTTAALPQGEYLPPGFAGFWRSDMGPVTSTVERLDGTFFTVTRLDTALFPLVTGDVTIDPALLVFPATVFRDEETLVTGAIRLRVLPLPAGAPETFGGLVGVATVTAALDQPQVIVGEPVRLRLTVRGSGNVEQMPPPEVPLPDGWSIYADGTAYRAEVERGQVVGEKVFEWLITAEESGTYTLEPPITLAYFNPETGVYETVSAPPLALDVLPAPDGDPAVEEVAVPAPASAPALLPVSAASALATRPPWLLWAAPVTLALLAWLRRRRVQRRLVGSAARRSQALAQAQRTLRAARGADPDTAGRQLVRAVLTYVADRLGREPATVTREDAAAALRRHGVEDSTAAQLEGCLALADEGRFGPADGAQTAPLIDRTLIVLSKVDAQWHAD